MLFCAFFGFRERRIQNTFTVKASLLYKLVSPRSTERERERDREREREIYIYIYRGREGRR